MKNCIGKELSKIPMPVRVSHAGAPQARGCCRDGPALPHGRLRRDPCYPYHHRPSPRIRGLDFG